MDKNIILTKKAVVFFLAMLCCFLWGSATPAIKTGYELFRIDSTDSLSIILFAGIRFFLAGILVILFQSAMDRKFLKMEKKALPSVLMLSLAQTILQYFCYYIGLAHVSGVTGTILSGTSGFFSIVIVCLIIRTEKLTANKIIGCIMGLLGIIIMNITIGESLSFHFALNGEFLVLMSTICLAVSGILIKKYSANFNVVMLSGYQFAIGGLIMIIISLLLGGRIYFDFSLRAIFLMLYLAMISAVAYTIWGILMKYNPVSSVSIFVFMTPIFGVILSAIFLNEIKQALMLNKIIALVLVTLGIYIVNRKEEAKVQKK